MTVINSCSACYSTQVVFPETMSCSPTFESGSNEGMEVDVWGNEADLAGNPSFVVTIDNPEINNSSSRSLLVWATERANANGALVRHAKRFCYIGVTNSEALLGCHLYLSFCAVILGVQRNPVPISISMQPGSRQNYDLGRSVRLGSQAGKQPAQCFVFAQLPQPEAGGGW
jgi:hypothetical protein